MANVWFILATIGILLRAASSNNSPEFWTDPKYDSRLQTVVDFLWKTSEIDISKRDNALFFLVSSLTDVQVINLIGISTIMDAETKQVVKKLLELPDNDAWNPGYAEDRQLSRLLNEDMRIRTILYRNGEAEIKREVDEFLKERFNEENTTRRFVPFYANSSEEGQRQRLIRTLTTEVRSFLFSRTCGVTSCPVLEIVSRKSPFAMVTLATWNISLEGGFEWTVPTQFALPDGKSRWVHAAQGFMKYEYADVKITESCKGRVIRFAYKSNFRLTFLMQVGHTCGSPENLWNAVLDVKLNDLEYSLKFMLVSIPLFEVSAKIDLRMKLSESILRQAFDDSSSGLFDASAFQLAEITFSPKVSKRFSKPVINPHGVPNFVADKPFFFALHHTASQLPMFAGLVQNPGCTSECYEFEI